MRGKRIWTVVLSIVFTVLLLFGLSELTVKKNVITEKKGFFDYAGEYDVLFIGTSHLMDGVFPRFLWQDYGIASFNLANGGNRLTMEYWQLICALDYSRPKLVVVDCFQLCDPYKTSSSIGFIHTAWDPFPLSAHKIEAVKDLWTENYAQKQEQKYEILFPFITYHNRWEELSIEDVVVPDSVMKGGQLLSRVGVPAPSHPSSESSPVTEDTVAVPYLYGIISVCREREIPLLLTYLPFPADEDRYREANLAGDIAAECGVRYVNFLGTDLIDESIDCYDSDSHMNASGTQKITRWLGEYIRTHYSVPDRRGDPAYKHWEEEDPLYLEEVGAILEQLQSPEEYLMFLRVWDGPILLCAREDSAVYADPRLVRLIENIPRDGQLSAFGDTADPYTLFVDNGRGLIRENKETDRRLFAGTDEDADLRVLVLDDAGEPVGKWSRSFTLDSP